MGKAYLGLKNYNEVSNYIQSYRIILIVALDTHWCHPDKAELY